MGRERGRERNMINIICPFPMSQSLCQFCSKVLEELEIVINDLETQLQSGVNMVLRDTTNLTTSGTS